MVFDGDVKARVSLAIEEYKNSGCYFNNEMYNDAQEASKVAKLYKKSGWKAVAELISDINHKCWERHYMGDEHISKFYANLYHAMCAWYQGYPANAEEQALVDDGREEEIYHVSDEDFSNIYRYLD